MKEPDLWSLIDCFEVPIIVLTRNFEIVMQNKASIQFLGKVIGKKCYEVFHNLDSPPPFCRILAFLNGDRGWEELYEQKLKKWLMVKVNQIRLENEDLFLHFVVDVSEIKRREIEFQKTSELLSLVTKIVRHDVLNALTAVRGYLEIIEEKCGELARKAIHELDDAVKILKQTEYLPKRSELKPYKLREIIEKVGAKFRVQITIQGDCIVLADDNVFSIFDNLIRNAVDHGKAEKISIKMEPEGEFCRLLFSDNGVGIAKEIRERIFEDGFTTSPEHSGIGLFLVKLLMQRYGGEISLLDSEIGTTFLLRFKRYDDKNSPIAQSN
uniref:PAS domain-containing sensor histidine kinase n=1 Tax=Archaeoglobus fulgidus TaxID=2234 RepID=A0A7J3M3E4_ARCFL